jgi:hypothetical protein
MDDAGFIVKDKFVTVCDKVTILTRNHDRCPIKISGKITKAAICVAFYLLLSDFSLKKEHSLSHWLVYRDFYVNL